MLAEYLESNDRSGVNDRWLSALEKRFPDLRLEHKYRYGKHKYTPAEKRKWNYVSFNLHPLTASLTPPYLATAKLPC